MIWCANRDEGGDIKSLCITSRTQCRSDWWGTKWEQQDRGDPWRQRGGVNMWELRGEEELNKTERNREKTHSGGTSKSLEAICMSNQPDTYQPTHASLSLCQTCLLTDFPNKAAIDTGWMRLIRHREEQLCRGLQVWDRAPSTHSPHLIFRQIFITINLAWLCDIKIPRIDNLSLENRSWGLCCSAQPRLPAPQTRASDEGGHFSGTLHLIPNLCCCCAQGATMHFNTPNRVWEPEGAPRKVVLVVVAATQWGNKFTSQCHCTGHS